MRRVSPRQQQLLALLCAGMPRAEMALALGMQESSVRNLQRELAHCMGTAGRLTRSAIVQRAVDIGIVTQDAVSLNGPANAETIMPPYTTVLIWRTDTQELTIDEPFCPKCGAAYAALAYAVEARFPISIEDLRVSLGKREGIVPQSFPPGGVRNFTLLCPTGHVRKALIRGPRATLEIPGDASLNVHRRRQL